MAKTLSTKIKDLKISGPSALGLMSSNLKSSVILVAKFDFHAETKEELSVSKGDVLKLLDRFSNGWVLVKFIDKVVPPGLVPCLYVDIAVNDPNNPITAQWLHQKSGQESQSFFDAQVQGMLENNAPLTFNNMPYPLTVTVSHYLTYENRFWYRVDVTYSTGQQGYLCRYYQDFYDLHASLLELYNGVDGKLASEFGKPPKLPEPIPSNKRDSAEQQELFSVRCRQLSTYMSELIKNKRYQVSSALVDWLDKTYCERPGFVVDDALNDTNEVISQQILPGSVILASESKLEKVPSPEIRKAEPSKYVVPPGSNLQRSKSKNIYNHYHQATLPGIGRSTSVREPLRSISQKRNVSQGVERSKTITPVTAGQPKEFKNVHAPLTPNMQKVNTSFGSLPSPQTPGTQIAQIKCKIKTQSSDILVVKLNKADISSLDEFKNLIYQKVAFNNLFIKLPNSESFQEIDSPEINSLQFLHYSDRVLLLVT